MKREKRLNLILNIIFLPFIISVQVSNDRNYNKYCTTIDKKVLLQSDIDELTNENSVREINLSNQKYTSIDENTFGDDSDNNLWVQLESLNLSYNHIPEIQDKFKRLSNLKELNISFNCLLQIKQDDFVGLYSLERLDLSNNFISQFTFDGDYNYLSSLVVLDLSNNLIKSESKFPLFLYPALEYLYLANNSFTEFTFEAAEEYRVIKEVDFSHCALNNIFTVDKGVLKYPELKFEIVKLNHNNMKVIETKLNFFVDYFYIENCENLSKVGIQDLDHVQHLYMKNNIIQSFSAFSRYSEHYTTKVLDLRHNNIEECITRADEVEKIFLNDNKISNLSKILIHSHVLDFSSNKIEEIDFETTRHFITVKQMNLKNNSIGSIKNVDGFKDFAGLFLGASMLAVMNNKLNCTQLLDLRNNLTKLNIITDIPAVLSKTNCSQLSPANFDPVQEQFDEYLKSIDSIEFSFEDKLTEIMGASRHINHEIASLGHVVDNIIPNIEEKQLEIHQVQKEVDHIHYKVTLLVVIACFVLIAAAVKVLYVKYFKAIKQRRFPISFSNRYSDLVAAERATDG